MRRMKIRAFAISACFISIFILLEGFAWIPGYRDKLPIVQKVPPASEITDPTTGLIDFYPHISKVERPAETFDFPIQLGEIGPVEPLFSGANGYPFICELEKSNLPQPIVDNHNGYGVPVFAEDDDGNKLNKVVGYSKDCLIPSFVSYYYKVKGKNKVKQWTPDVTDAELITRGDKTVPFVIRAEVGSINRFVYLIAMLKGDNDIPAEPDTNNWNNKLLYQFRGGVGIGYRQGRMKVNKVLSRRLVELEKGYAMAYSSGTHTRNHYNILLAEDTALRVKQQFISTYGEPEYTVGVGGSGGGLQQYLLSQNNPGIIDAAIPQYSYPDMVTQTPYAMDCELLEHYFDVKDKENPQWRDWDEREKIEGMNARNGAEGKIDYMMPFAHINAGNWPKYPSGSSECVNGYRGLTALMLNPAFTYFLGEVSPAVLAQTKWSFWDNMSHLFGKDDSGFAKRTWDNEGVQYGLGALIDGEISVQEFMDLNARVGGWKPSADMRNEEYWLLFGGDLPIWFSVWGDHNAYQSHDGGKTPARRTRASLDAIEVAYRSGQVFLGDVDLPIIDVRHYLEDKLDMHHTHASFASRLRIQRANGHADNQAIWVSRKKFDPTHRAFDVIDEWMKNIRENPGKSVVENKPAVAQDTCFDSRGATIFAGDDVWDGEWNNKPIGRCTGIYPHYKSSRMVAGDDFHGDVLKCHLQPIEQAIKQGVYGDFNIEPYSERLKTIFPNGVCDYALGDMGRPADV